MPRIKPPRDIKYEKKFRKKVEGMICTTIRNGKIHPSMTNTNPMIINWTG
jgi:hypothetical protein